MNGRTDDGVNIRPPMLGFETVDPNEDIRRSARARGTWQGVRGQGGGDIRARLRLLRLWNRVLQIQNDGIGARVEDLREKGLAVSGRKQVTAEKPHRSWWRRVTQAAPLARSSLIRSGLIFSHSPSTDSVSAPTLRPANLIRPGVRLRRNITFCMRIGPSSSS